MKFFFFSFGIFVFFLTYLLWNLLAVLSRVHCASVHVDEPTCLHRSVRNWWAAFMIQRNCETTSGRTACVTNCRTRTLSSALWHSPCPPPPRQSLLNDRRPRLSCWIVILYEILTSPGLAISRFASSDDSFIRNLVCLVTGQRRGEERSGSRGGRCEWGETTTCTFFFFF